MKKGTLFIGGFVAASTIAFVIYMIFKPVPPIPPQPIPKFCDCNETNPAPTCESCDTTCTLQHLECHRITEADFLERAYPTGPDTNVGMLYPATCQAITDIAEDTLCNSNIFECTDISTSPNNSHLSNKKIRISVGPRKKSTRVYYELQVIKALLTPSSIVPEPAVSFLFYNGQNCKKDGEDILFRAVDVAGNTIYYGDLSSDYPSKSLSIKGNHANR